MYWFVVSLCSFPPKLDILQFGRFWPSFELCVEQNLQYLSVDVMHERDWLPLAVIKP